MKLYLLRHASAADVAPSDAARPLTRHGENEATRAGTALAKLGAQPAHVLSSPFLRALQTARLTAAALTVPAPVTALDELCNGSSTSTLLTALKPWAEAPELLLVGHMPSLAEHVAALIAKNAPVGLGFDKAGAACVELDRLKPGAGHLVWLMRHTELARHAG
jgi:phosphohistidine phosphatase